MKYTDYLGLIAAIVLLAVHYSPDGPTITREKVGQVQAESSCVKPGFCMSCGLDVMGKYSCGLQYKLMCPGVQAALFDVYQVTRTYTDGEVRRSKERVFVEALGVCEDG